MNLLTISTLLFSLITFSLCQECAYWCPAVYEYWQTVDYPGGDLVRGVNQPPNGGTGCPCNATTGPIYLYRPGDDSFKPIKFAYWNSSLNPVNYDISAPDPGVYGYGFQWKIVPDKYSPSKEPIVSPTFTIVTLDFFEQAYAQQGMVLIPNPDSPTTWDSKGEQMIAWTDLQPQYNNISILLFKSSDATWGPLVLATEVTHAASSYNDVVEYTFTYSTIPESSAYYQFAFVRNVTATSEILAVSGPIDIVAHSVTTQTLIYEYSTTITAKAEPTGK